MRRIGTSAAVAALLATMTLTPTATAGNSMISARQHFFGVQNVNPSTGAVRSDRVIVSWASVATLVASIRGHVVLLDTYLHKGEDTPNYVPTTTDELVALKPRYIFVGHGHFDHANTAGEIAARTGATVVGTDEHCDQARQQAVEYDGPGTSIRCRSAIPAGAAPGYQTSLDGLLTGVRITALKHVHSAAEPPDPSHSHTDTVVPVPDPGSILLHPPGPAAVEGLLDAADAEGGSVLYQFRAGHFALTWHDSSGPLKEQAPSVFTRLRALPRTDVQAGAVIGFNQFTNGLRDPAMYGAALCPQIFVPLHHDFVTEYGSADDFEEPMRRTLAYYGAEPELQWLADPHDYVRPTLMTYDIADPRWQRTATCG